MAAQRRSPTSAIRTGKTSGITPSSVARPATPPPRELVRAAAALGWPVGRTRRGHLRCVKVGRPVVFSAGTPYDVGALANCVALLRQLDHP